VARIIVILVGLLMATLASSHAVALDLDIRRSPHNSLDFSMLVHHDNLELQNNDAVVDTRLNRIGVLVYDVPEHAKVHFGLNLGYAFVSHSQQALFDGEDLDGFFLGVSMRTVVLQSASARLMFLANYLFQDVSGESTTHNLSLTWNEINTSLLLSYDLNASIKLAAGVNGGWIKATQKAKGLTAQTLRLAPEPNAGFVINVGYRLSGNESVGIQAHTGYLQGLQLQFQRWF